MMGDLLLVRLLLLMLLTTTVYGQCNEALGLESGIVEDSQITASSSPYVNRPPSTARLRGQYGWVPRSTKDYLTIDFLDYRKITGLSVQGALHRAIKALSLFYSLDGLVWETYKDNHGNQYIDVSSESWFDVVRTELDSPVKARYVAISSRSAYSGVRLEVYGCNTSVDKGDPTVIHSDIRGNTIWTTSGSPYVLSVQVTVRPSTHLQIQPGVMVIFNATDAGILIRGSLTAAGIQGLPISFWSSDVPTAAQTLWQGLRTEQTGVFSCDFCTIRHAKVGVMGPPDSMSLNNTKVYLNSNGIILTNGGSGTKSFHRLQISQSLNSGLIVSSDWVSRSGLFFEGCTFQQNGKNALLLSSPCDVELVRCNVRSNGDSGIASGDDGFRLAVIESNITGNSWFGLKLSHSGYVNIESSRVDNNRVGLLRSNAGITFLQNSKFRFNSNEGINIDPRLNGILNISSCIFERNKHGLLVHAWANRVNSLVRITDSEFTKNTYAGVYVKSDTYRHTFNISLTYNKFQGDVTNSKAYAIRVSLKDLLRSRFASVNIIGNNMTHFGGSSDIIAYEGYTYLNYAKIPINVSENSFEDSFGSYALYLYADGATIAHNIFRNSSRVGSLKLTGSNSRIYRNVFETPNSTYDLITFALYDDQTVVDASRNYWGITDKRGIRSRIYDVYHNISRAEIQIDPYFTSKSMEMTSSGTTIFTDDDPSDVGGVLQGDVLLHPDQSLVVKRTIVVPEGKTLTIMPNVTLTFHGAQGVIVKGSLKINGSSTGLVILQNGTKSRWGGVMLTSSNLEITHGVLKAARTIAGVRNTNCSVYLAFSLSHSSVEIDTLTLRSHRFNVTISKSQLVTQKKAITLSTCPGASTKNEYGHILLENSEFTSRAGGISCESAQTLTTVMFLNNTFNVEEGRVFRIKGQYLDVEVANNSFNAPSGTANIDLSGDALNRVFIRENNFNVGNMELKSQQSLDEKMNITMNVFKFCLLILKTPDVIIRHNVFETNLVYFIKFASKDFRNTIINASNNYWGKDKFSEIKVKIYDKSNDVALPEISIMPFFKDREMLELVETTPFLDSYGTLGGAVDGTVTLTRAQSPYTVLSNIIVGREDTLIIDAGVQLLFKDSVGMRVEGSLYVRGSRDMPVRFHPANAGIPWEGVKVTGQPRIVRFAGGTDEREGRVEVLVGSTYSTICHDDFDILDANVVCRMAGFDPEGGVKYYYHSKFGDGSGEIKYTKLHCVGNESHVDECINKRTRCYHFEDISVRCLGNYLKAPIPDTQLEYLEINDTLEGLVLDRNITKISNVKSFFSKASGFTLSEYGTSLPIMEGIESSFNGLHGITIRGINKHTRLTVVGCVLSGNGKYGLYLSAYGLVTLNNCTVAGNQIGMGSEFSLYLDIALTNSVVKYNKRHAIYCLPRGVGTGHEVRLSVLRSSLIEHDTRYKNYKWETRFHFRSVIYMGGYSITSGSLLFEENVFNGNMADVFEFDYYFINPRMSLFITNNTYVNNTGQILRIRLISQDGNNVNITSNKFINNIVISSSVPMIGITDIHPSSVIDISGNMFMNNSAASIIHMSKDDSTYSNIKIHSNSMVHNQVTNVLLIEIYETEIQNNSFFNPNALCELKVAPFKKDREHDARWNFWGFTELSQIKDRICGFDVNMELGFVSYIPYLLSNTTMSEARVRPTDFFEMGAVGGVVEEELTLDGRSEPYIIERSIMIRRGGKLAIHAGVKLLFMKKRGIYTSGSVKTLSSTSERIVLGNHTDDHWHGIVFAHTSGIILRNVNITGSFYGLVTYTDNMTLSDCSIAHTVRSGMTIGSGVTMVNLGRTAIIKSKSYGIMIHSNALLLRKGFVHNNALSGIYHNGKTGSIFLEEMDISNNGEYGVYVNMDSYRGNHHIRLSNSFLHDHNNKPAIRLISSNYNGYSNITVGDCIFDKNYGSAQISAVGGSYRDDRKKVIMSSNTFRGHSTVAIVTTGFSEVLVTDNRANNATSYSKCLFDIDLKKGSWSSQTLALSVRSNLISHVSGLCAFSLSAFKISSGSFLFNQISHSTFTEGTLILNLENYTLSENIFDNPNSDYELKVTKLGSGYINATHNWWGTTDEVLVEDKIVERSADPRLLNVIHLPISVNQAFDCSQVSNCSGKGECVRPNGCSCLSGWKGTDCTEFDCSDLSECNGGRCVGPNLCKCADGWTGNACAVATCYLTNNCSGRGFCGEPDKCTCLSQYRGTSCDSCAPNTWGRNCAPCPKCLHGSCDTQTGTCICESSNWTGTLCDQCSETFYGPDCLPLPTVLSVSPDAGPDVGGTPVHIRGHNFKFSNTSNYKCKFGAVTVAATRISRQHFTCTSPKLSQRTVHVEISSDGVHFTSNKVSYTFVVQCPTTACGSTDSPPHGQCLFGQCMCTLPWTGDSCSVEALPPVVRAINDSQLTEGQTYKQMMSLVQGSHAIRWKLISSPLGMTIDQDTGNITWISVNGRSTPYVIKVRAQNIVGHDDVQWLLSIPLSYSAVVDSLTPSGTLAYPAQILISGHLDVSGSTWNLTSAVVKVQIRNKELTRDLETHAEDTSPFLFDIIYYPQPDDSGEFSVSASHPADTEFLEQKKWRVQSMICDPKVVSLTAYLDTPTVTFPAVANLTNNGLDSLENISATIQSYSYSVDSAWVYFGEQRTSNITVLPSLSSVPFDLIIEQKLPLQTELYVVIRSVRGTRTVLRVQLNLKIRRPLLKLYPSNIKTAAARGKQTIININVTNTGEATARDVNVQIPSGLLLKVAAISKPRSSSSERMDLEPGETATVVLVYTVPMDRQLGETDGSLLIISNDSSSRLTFTFYITSDDRHDIQVIVEDEFTYFAADKPLLAEAVVTLTQPRRMFSKTFITNETGILNFDGIRADRYTLQVEAANHTSKSVIIVVDGSTSTYRVFLQRTAVTYTWSVTKTTFEDKYTITLESTFETRVPMPVVTVEPASVNFIPYEEGRLTRMVFTLTNHGFIRADNVRFSLPNHPTLRFVQVVDPLGNLDANTSIIVPIDVLPKKISKRSLSTVCGFIVLYDYTCGSVRTKSASVRLTRQYPGQPPASCGGGGRGRRIRGQVSGVGYRLRGYVGTNVPCDCVKGLIDNCYKPLLRLPFELIPGVGCLLDIYDISKIDKSSSAVSVATTVASFALDCGFGLSCPVCPFLFKYLNCLDGLSRTCMRSGRRRREVNSELVLEVERSRNYLKNFVDVSVEIFGNLSVVDIKGEWKQAFFKGVSENSPSQYLLDSSEVDIILLLVVEDDQTILNTFLQRWNNTFSSWIDGSSGPPQSNVMSLKDVRTLGDTFIENTRTVKERGFSSVFQYFGYTMTEYKKSVQEAKPEEGICAKVRIRITQDLVLTRDAFQARLEIENGEEGSLEKIDVDIFITRTGGNGSLENNLFSIGQPKLEGISDVSGTGTIATGVKGSADWLIVAYTGAAVDEDVNYDVGGTLSYFVADKEFNVPLLPDTITVTPNPSLTLAYFHEKYVQGDDPMTTQVEPVVPFPLAVMVTNKGNGIARQVKISSGQPEIIENEKGLLVSFKIIRAQLGMESIQPSLTVDFGDIVSRETKTARWWMTSTLKGRFYNYSATFENINPLGDPQLSVFESISYHDMIHQVRIDSIGADGLDDFLVNDVVDKDNLPDRLYDSSNGFYSYPVDSVSAIGFSKTKEEFRGRKKYMYVEILVPQVNKSWVYARVINNITRDLSSESLLKVTKDDGKNILIPQNSWLTSYYENKFYFHLFDNNNHQSNVSVYNAVFGPKNIYPPVFQNIPHTLEISPREPNSDILTAKATDLDMNNVSYSIEYGKTFSVDGQSGVVRNIVPLIAGHSFNITILAFDNGIPINSASTNITITVSTLISTESTTSSTKIIDITSKTAPTMPSVSNDTSGLTPASSTHISREETSSLSTSTPFTTGANIASTPDSAVAGRGVIPAAMSLLLGASLLASFSVPI